MIIGIDASRSLRPHKTGTEWYSYHVIRGLSELDRDNQYLLYSDRAVEKKDLDWLPANFSYKRLRWMSKSLWTQGRLSWEMMRKPCDVLFVPSHVIPGVHPQKTINTVHDVGFLEYPEGYSAKQLQYLKWSTKLAVRVCAKIITISEFSKRELVRCFKADPNKVFVTHLGYDRDKYIPRKREELGSFFEKYSLNKSYLYYSGRLEFRKNIDGLLKIFEGVRDAGVDIDLVITGPVGYRGEYYLDAIKRHKYGSDIHYLGWVGDEDKIALLQGAIALVFPSFYEGFGLPVIEAQGCGVPVICSSVASLPEVGGDGALYFDPKKSGEAVGHVLNIVGSSSARDQLIASGLSNARRFDWGATARQTHDVLTRW